MKILLLLSLLLATTNCASLETEARMKILQQKSQMLYTVVKVQGLKGRGSGVVIFSENGYSLILTAKHVIGKARKFEVKLYPDEVSYPATILGKSKKYDLALLRIEHEHPYVAEISSKLKVSVFQTVWKIGGGMGQDPFPGKGIVTGVKESHISVSSGTIYGDSGGAVFIQQGPNYRLVGIIVSVAILPKKIPVYHIGYAHDLESIVDFLTTQ